MKIKRLPYRTPPERFSQLKQITGRVFERRQVLECGTPVPLCWSWIWEKDSLCAGGHIANSGTGVPHSKPWRHTCKPRGGRRFKEQAFTLVEMLLVLVILATLAAIVYPKVAGRSEQARVTAAQTQIGNFKTALNAFEVDNGYFPKGKNGLLDLVQKPQDAPSWHGPYLDNIPKDPWGNDYLYQNPGRHNAGSYDISSAGPPGKDTPIGNWTVQR